MKHVNIHNVFPEAIVKEVQKHYSGGYLFIPKRSNKERDTEIRSLFKNGTSVNEIASKVNLSGMRIRQILSVPKK